MNPRILMLRLTENCNAGCFMCKHAHVNHARFITLEEIDEIRRKIQGRTFEAIRLTGGETFLHKQLPTIIQKFSSDGLVTSIITNGYYLPYRSQAVIDAGLNQFVISLDGSTPELHNELRDTKNLFQNIQTGIQKIRSYNSDVKIRINTVVSHRNIHDLNNIADLINQWEIEQWSIIPVKGQQVGWEQLNLNMFLEMYSAFRQKVSELKQTQLIGYSANWAGRDVSEVNNFLKTNKPFTPRGKCHVVENVRFYIPSTNTLAPCNCAVYRSQVIQNMRKVETGIESETFDLNSVTELAEWLKEHGPDACTGCEPSNAYLGEHPEVLDEHILNW